MCMESWVRDFKMAAGDSMRNLVRHQTAIQVSVDRYSEPNASFLQCGESEYIDGLSLCFIATDKFFPVPIWQQRG